MATNNSQRFSHGEPALVFFFSSKTFSTKKKKSKQLPAYVFFYPRRFFTWRFRGLFHWYYNLFPTLLLLKVKRISVTRLTHCISNKNTTLSFLFSEFADMDKTEVFILQSTQFRTAPFPRKEKKKETHCLLLFSIPNFRDNYHWLRLFHFDDKEWKKVFPPL